MSQTPQSADDARLRAAGSQPTRPPGWLLSLALHAALLAAFFALPRSALRPPGGSSSIVVDLVQAPGSSGPGAPAAPEAVRPEAKAEPRHKREPIDTDADASGSSDILSEAQLMGAVTAHGGGEGGEGAGGAAGGCNMLERLEGALGRDATVQAAVADAGRTGKAVLLWDGDWVRAAGQDGRGLSGVREAILWELAFAPPACRDGRLRGLVVFSLSDGTRFAIGAGEWGWSDLLGLAPLPARR